MYPKDPYEAKYQFWIKKRESTDLKHFNDSKAFMVYSNDMNNIYKNIEEYNPDKKCKIEIFFDDMIADSSIINWGYEDNFRPVYLLSFLMKRFRAYKNIRKQKPTNKT